MSAERRELHRLYQRRKRPTSRLVDTLEIMDQTGEMIVLDKGRAMLWLEEIPLEILNGMIALRAVSPVEKSRGLRLKINDVGRQLVENSRLAIPIRQAVRDGRPFTVKRGEIVWKM